MAATVKVARYTGAAPASTDVTSACTRAGASDEAANGSSIRVPSGGSNYSYWVTTALVATAAPDTQIDTLKWYSDGTNSLGTGLWCQVAVASGYVQADGVAGSTGSALDQTNHTALYGADSASDAFQYTSTATSMLSISGSIDNSTGSIGDQYVVYQVTVENTAGAGNSSEEEFTFQFDES